MAKDNIKSTNQDGPARDVDLVIGFSMLSGPVYLNRNGSGIPETPKTPKGDSNFPAKDIVYDIGLFGGCREIPAQDLYKTKN